MTITEFLLARIAEDEAAQERKFTWPHIGKQTEQGWLVAVEANDDWVWLTFDNDKRGTHTVEMPVLEALQEYGTPTPDERVLAECAAKRLILEEARGPEAAGDLWDTSWEREMAEGYRRVLRALAAVYKDHEDYDLDWAVN